ncbi:MAG: dodecin family protein [Acidobacteriota bacterium]
MSVAKNIEISSTSTKGFEDAISQGIKKASQTIKNIRGAWVKEQEVAIDGGSIKEYKVVMVLTFVLGGDENFDDGTTSAKNKKPSLK